MLKKHTIWGIVFVASIVVLFPSLDQEKRRYLKVQIDGSESYQKKIVCPHGQEPSFLDWSSLAPNVKEQILQIDNHRSVSVKASKANTGLLGSWGNDGSRSLQLTAGAVMFHENTILPPSSLYSTGLQHAEVPRFPSGFGTIELNFSHPISNFSFTLADIGSDMMFSKVVRVRVYNKERLLNVSCTPQGGISAVKDFVYQPDIDKNIGSVWFGADGDIDRVLVDLSLFGFYISGGSAVRKIDIENMAFCSTPQIVIEDSTSEGSVPQAPEVASQQKSVIVQTPTVGDKNLEKGFLKTAEIGEVFMTGVTGSTFKFLGRTGSWYSAISTKNLQWNVRVHKFECPEDGDTFVTGSGFTIFDEESKPIHQIQISVANAYSTNTGCGTEIDSTNDFDCLAAGSLEIVVDGRKLSKSFDQTFSDDLRIIAFNTVGRCSSPWFNLTEVSSTERTDSYWRNVSTPQWFGPSVNEACLSWLEQRITSNDILKVTGTWSTALIMTDSIAFHVEYRQEQERCNAHDLKVWISHARQDILSDEWRGIIGETKSSLPSSREIDSTTVTEDYGVLSPFSLRCSKGCIDR